ncbi:phosphatidylinositol-3,5-bisphosphate 5-phosphatase [Coemansia sp. RSA 1646]|nr:phosphatidylinositol-3,5-bisphosphate 5-phosphatase [Coemansia sp. RSA 1646]
MISRQQLSDGATVAYSKWGIICNATQGVGVASAWTVALIHGYVDQSRLSIFGRDVYTTLIARRSCIFAGVRYLKHGGNHAGYVTNNVETEQTVNMMEVISFNMPFRRPFSNPSYTVYVQHRGSIPLFWSQDTSGIAPKSPININVHDPYFVEAGRQFDNLFHCYGMPIIVLNLIKTEGCTKRESALGKEFSKDISRAEKNRQEGLLAILEVIAEETLTLAEFFHNGGELYSNYLKRRSAGDTHPLGTQMRRQTGVVHSNCIDCLDRTNAAQHIIGRAALAHQLFELGQINEPLLSFNTDAAMIIEEMYHDLGNTIALQYGGSHLVNTVQVYRWNTNWRSHSRDIVESLRRYYSNSLLDMEQQEAITHFVEKYLLPECRSDDKQLIGDGVDTNFDNSDGIDGIQDIDEDGLEAAASRLNQVGKPVFRRSWTTLGSDFEDSEKDSGHVSDYSGKHNSGYGDTFPKDGEEEIYNRACEKEETPQVFQPLKIGGWTTDGITSALQEPSVSQPELDEYERYVHQFDDLKRWIVPSSDMLYSEYAKNKQDSTLSGHLSRWAMQNSVYPGGNSPISSKRQASAVAGSLKVKTALDSGYLLHGDAERRLNTLVPRRKASQMPQVPFFATTSRSYSNRLFASFDSMLPNSGGSGDSSGSQQQYSRNRSSMSSNERGSLWRLWSQNGASGSFGSRYTLGNRSSAHLMAAKAF